MEASHVVSQVGGGAIWRPSVEWWRVWMSGLMAATGHGMVQPGNGWTHGVAGVTAARDWLAATSSDCIKGAVGWHGGKTEKNRTKNRGTQKGRKRHVEEETYLTLIASESY